MKFLFIIDHLSSGGAQRQMTTLAIALVRLGHEVHLLYYRQDEFQLERAVNGGVCCERIEPRGKLHLLTLIAKKIRKISPDLILAFLTGASVLAICARYLSGKRIPVIVSERNQIEGSKSIARLTVASVFYKFANAITVNAYHVEEEFKQKFPWLKKSTKTIWNGLDLDYFHPGKRDEVDEGSPLVLLGMASLFPFKGQKVLAESLVISHKKYGWAPKVKWACRRTHDLSEQELAFKHEIDQVLRDAKLSEAWEWIDELSDVRPELAKCAALVHPSTRDGMSNSVCEAIACGVPVIATDALEHPRLIAQGKTGFLFEPLSAEDLADKIYAFAQLSVEQRVEMGEKAREFAVHNLADSKMSENYLRLFKSYI